MQLTARRHDRPTCDPNTPLWQRAPTRGSDGRAISDLMMLIPGLKDRPGHDLRQTVAVIQQTINHYSHAVVFADLNLHLNVLWISVKPLPGIVLEIATAINASVPEARLVAQKLD